MAKLVGQGCAKTVLAPTIIRELLGNGYLWPSVREKLRHSFDIRPVDGQVGIGIKISPVLLDHYREIVGFDRIADSPVAFFKQCGDQTLTFGVEFLLAVLGPLSKAPRIVTDHSHHMQQLTLQVTSEIRKCFDDRLLVRRVPPHFVGYLTGQNE